jgi:hypothetical protein
LEACGGPLLSVERMHPVKAFLLVLCRYLRDRGGMVLGMAEATGQRKLLMSLYGLWRRHEAEETGYLRFMHIVEEIIGDRRYLEELKRYGIEEFREVDGEPYMVVDVEKLRRLDCSQVEADATR